MMVFVEHHRLELAVHKTLDEFRSHEHLRP